MDYLQEFIQAIYLDRLISPSAPFGGIKDSGYGKEAGIDSIKDYTRVKTTWFYTSDEPTLDPFSIR